MDLKVTDYELLYAIKEHNENALNLMIQKYKAMMNVYIYTYDILDKEGAYQECVLCLLNCIRQYNEGYGAPFYSYYSKALRRRMISLSKNCQNDKYNIYLDETIYHSFAEEKIIYPVVFKDQLKNLIYNEIIMDNCSIQLFCEKYNINKKKVYNLLYAVKNELKQMNKKDGMN